MPFTINIAHPDKKKCLIVRLHADGHTEKYQVVGDGFIWTLISNRPFVRSFFGQRHKTAWAVEGDIHEDRLLKEKIVKAIMEIIEPR